MYHLQLICKPPIIEIISAKKYKASLRAAVGQILISQVLLKSQKKKHLFAHSEVYAHPPCKKCVDSYGHLFRPQTHLSDLVLNISALPARIIGKACDQVNPA